MFLCHSYHEDGYGVICTNKCEHYLTCVKPKIPLLIHAVSIECSIRGSSLEDYVQATFIKIDSAQPDAYINDLAYHGLECKESDLIHVRCCNPSCSNTISILKSQWNFFYDVYHRKYERMMFPYCSRSCMEKQLGNLSPGKYLLFVSTDYTGVNEKHTHVTLFDNPALASV